MSNSRLFQNFIARVLELLLARVRQHRLGDAAMLTVLIELSRCRGIQACCETGSSMGALMVDGMLGMIIPMQSDKR